MNKRIWAAALAAAVTLTSAVTIPYDRTQVQTVLAAGQSSSSGSEVEDTSTDGKTTAGGFTFTVTGKEATITGYGGSVKELTIPTKITVTKTTSGGNTGGGNTGGSQKPNEEKTEYTVTAIADNAFSGNLGIQKLTMSGGTDKDGRVFGIRTIGDRAFFACHDLTTVEIASTTTSIGKYAFSDCVALNSMKVGDGNTRYKVIDNALYYYTAGSGTGTYKLVQYPLANNAAEYKVPDLVSFTLTEIAEGAFWGSPYLETITIPETVDKIGDQAFAQCKKLKSVLFPVGLKSLGSEAFRGDSALEEATIPAGVTTIQPGTFQGCESLKKVNMTNELKIIGNRAFQGCKSLTDFVVPGNVTTLGDQAFANCESLHEITIPMRTTSIGSGVFTGTKVTVLCHNGSQAATYAAANGLTAERTYTVSFYTNSTYSNLISSQEIVEGKDAIPPSVPGRDGYRMSWSGSVTAIKQDTRVHQIWSKLFDVTFVDSFNNRTQVVQVDEGKLVTPPSWTMSGYTLSWDKDLTDYVTENITVHAIWRNNTSGTTIGANATRPAEKGTDVTKGNNRYKVSSSNPGNPTVKFIGLVNENVSSVNIPETVSAGGVRYRVTLISSNALNGNKSITSVVINKNMKSISAKAFYNCKKLKKVKLKSKNIIKMNNKAFAKIHSKAKFYTYNSKIDKYRTLLKNAGVKKPSIKRL
ncbi:MAG: leucine-rich repeat domain-containing protein [Eubacterium sp.]|nr:leucine-rich repeat domain-containing protein [Eubacterium sp.]